MVFFIDVLWLFSPLYYAFACLNGHFLRLEHAVSPYKHGGAVLAGNEHGGRSFAF